MDPATATWLTLLHYPVLGALALGVGWLSVGALLDDLRQAREERELLAGGWRARVRDAGTWGLPR